LDVEGAECVLLALATPGYMIYGIIMYDPLAKYHQIPFGGQTLPWKLMEKHKFSDILIIEN
jgi:hypothetical protein